MRAAATKVTTDRPVRIGSVPIGSGRAVLIAGPCAVEPDYVETAQLVAALGVDVLRGSAFKPRTRPESFQGMGRAGLELIAEARVRTGLPVVTDVLPAEDIAKVAAISDCIQLGSRNIQNTRLPVEAAE